MKGKRMNIYKRIASIVLCFAMLLAYMPVTAYAAEETSGTCGDNATWSYEAGTLTISGSGAMTDFQNLSDRPWDSCVASIERIEIEPGVTSIGESAFYGCTSLKTVSIPNSVTSIEERVFARCKGLKSVTIENGVTSIGEATFENCTSLTSVIIPDSVESIGRYAFSGCTGLTEIEIPNSITRIDAGAFSGCTGLTEIEIRDSVKSIGDYAFSGCTGLTEIEIPNSVTSIGSSVFSNCTGLTEIELPNSVKSIGEFVFFACDNLEIIHYLGTEVDWGSVAVEKVGNASFKEIMNGGYGHFCSLRIADEQTHIWSCSGCNETVKTESHDFLYGKCSCGMKINPTREYKADSDLKVGYALNENTLESIRCEGQNLINGEDYEYAVDTGEVTFKAAWLNTLDAGTHELTFAFATQDSSVTDTLTLTVTPAELTIVDATATSRDYDGTKDVAITGLTISGIKDTDIVGVSFENLTGTLSSANVGNYTRVTFGDLSKLVTLTGTDKDNYKLVYESGTEIGTNVTISKATATVTTAPIVTTLPFTGRAQALVRAGVTNDGTFMYSLSENGEYTSNIPTATEMGDYTVWYYVKGDTNHTDSAKASVKVIIKEGPHIENEEGKMGWDAILDEVEDVIESDTQHTVTVDMNGATVVPGDVLENIKGKDVTVEFDLGDGIVWTVNGKEITATDIEDIDFAVAISTEENSLDTIPVEVLNQVTGEKSHMEISLAHDGEFGFTAVLSLNLEAKNAGLFANLYYYNPATQAMEFICSDEIAADGTVDLTFTHASDYTIVIDEVAADAEGQEGAVNPGGIQAPQTGDVSNVTLWTLLLIAGLSMLVFAQKKYVR